MNKPGSLNKIPGYVPAHLLTNLFTKSLKYPLDYPALCLWLIAMSRLLQFAAGDEKVAAA